MKLFNAIAAAAVIGASLHVAQPAEARCTMFTPSPPTSKILNCSRAVIVKQQSNMIHYRIYVGSKLFADAVLESSKTGTLRLLSGDAFYHGHWERKGNEVTILFENYMAFSFYV